MPEHGEVRIVQPAPLAFVEIIGQGKAANPLPMQFLHPVPRRCDHPLYLVVLAFEHRKLELPFVALFGANRCNGL